MAEEVVAAYATSLFIRSEAEIRRPVVLLSGEKTNVYGVLEKHFRETALPPSERFWRTVRTQWTPQLDTWRPRVNGVQLKVLAGARLPESEDEWSALRGALMGVRQHLRADTSVDRLQAELRDFVGMVVDWWQNRKKTEPSAAINGAGLMKRVASSGLLLGGAPLGMGLAKKPCLEYMPLAAVPQAPTQGPAVFPPTMYSAPEIVSHPLLAANGGSGRLPDRATLSPPAEQAPPPMHPQAQAPQQHDGSNHGGVSYLHHLTANGGETQLFGPLFPGDGEAASPQGGEVPQQRQLSALLPPMEAAGGGSGGGNGYYSHSPHGGDRREGSADNREPVRNAAGPSAADSKCFVTLNVGGHRFLTTAATLGAVPGSYLSKLAAQAASAAAKGRDGGEYFVDRSGKIFEYVLDYLRSQRFSDSASTLPRDERTLQLLAREADFYQLPGLADRTRAALLALAAPAAPGGQLGEDTPSDMPANIAAEGSAHGGQLLAGRFGVGGGAAAALLTLQQQAPQQATVLDALFMETGFQEACELAGAQASLLQQLNSAVQSKQAEGFAVVSCKCGTEREGQQRNLHYHVLLRKAAPSS